MGNWWESAKPAPQNGGDDWWKSAKPDQTVPKIRETELRQGKAPSWWEHGWQAAHDAFFGTPEQSDAEAEGAYTQPPPSRVASAIATFAPMVGIGPAALAGAGGGAEKIAAWAVENPRKVAALTNAAPALLRGDVSGAAKDAAIGLGAGELFGRARDVGRALVARRAGAAAVQGPTRPVIEAVKDELRAGLTHQLGYGVPEPLPSPVQGPPAPQPSAPRVMTSTGAMPAEPMAVPVVRLEVPAPGPVEIPESWRPPATPPKAEKPPKPAAPPEKPPAVDKGRDAAEAHAEMVRLAKQAAAQNPKIGQKIWIHWKDGKPIGVVTEQDARTINGLATRGKRPGEKVTFMRNLWGRPADTFAEQ